VDGPDEGLGVYDGFGTADAVLPLLRHDEFREVHGIHHWVVDGTSPSGKELGEVAMPWYQG